MGTSNYGNNPTRTAIDTVTIVSAWTSSVTNTVSEEGSVDGNKIIGINNREVSKRAGIGDPVEVWKVLSSGTVINLVGKDLDINFKSNIKLLKERYRRGSLFTVITFLKFRRIFVFVWLHLKLLQRHFYF